MIKNHFHFLEEKDQETRIINMFCLKNEINIENALGIKDCNLYY